MKILVDADCCPQKVRELILRTGKRRSLQVIFAANHSIPGTEGENSVMMVCPPGVNSADNQIVKLAFSGDLAVTRDLTLAKRLLEKNVIVINDRGRAFTHETINELLSLRDFTVGLADNGMDMERKAQYGKKEAKNFADSLDRELTRLWMA